MYSKISCQNGTKEIFQQGIPNFRKELCEDLHPPNAIIQSAKLETLILSSRLEPWKLCQGKRTSQPTSLKRNSSSELCNLISFQILHHQLTLAARISRSFSPSVPTIYHCHLVL